MTIPRARPPVPAQLSLTGRGAERPHQTPPPPRTGQRERHPPPPRRTRAAPRRSDFVDAIITTLDDAALDRLAEMLAPRIAARVRPVSTPDHWLDAKRAADYLGMSTTALHKLTAARSVPFEQDAAGCKLWFRRTELDAWRKAGGKRQTSPRTH